LRVEIPGGSIRAVETPSPADRLAADHDAATLAAALVARLRAAGRADLAGAVVALLGSADAAFLDPTPPNPHKEGSAV
jgi:hypothetical protein